MKNEKIDVISSKVSACQHCLLRLFLTMSYSKNCLVGNDNTQAVLKQQ